MRLIFRFCWDKLLHHWTPHDKTCKEFLELYPYAASTDALVKHMARQLGGTGYTIVVDSYYTHVSTFRDLVDMGYHAVGSVKGNRGVPLDAFWKKKDNKRKFGDCFHARTTDGKVLLQQWKGNGQDMCGCYRDGVSSAVTVLPTLLLADKQVVSVLSTLHTGVSGTAEKVATMKGVEMVRRNRKEGGAFASLVGPRPPAVSFYSRHMGGTDAFDQLRALNSVHRESKRWYVAVWYTIVDHIAANSFVLYKLKQGQDLKDQTRFRAELVDQLLCAAGVALALPRSVRQRDDDATDDAEGGGVVASYQPRAYGQHVPIPVRDNERRACDVCSALVLQKAMPDGRTTAHKANMKCMQCGGRFYCLTTERNHWEWAHKAEVSLEDGIEGPVLV